MAETTIFTMTDEQGREFKLIGDLEDIHKQIAKLHTNEVNEAEEDEYEEYVYWDGGEDRKSTEDDRFKELVDVSAYFDDEFDWSEIMNGLDKKKNGTFKKGRVKRLHRARSFSYKYEDGYGYMAPEVRIKVRSDLEAYVEFKWQVEQW